MSIYLGDNRLSELWANIKKNLSKKQDILTGAPGQLIGIGDDGAAKATVYPSNRNLLINWYLANPINHLGETTYIVTGTTSVNSIYHVDCFRTMATGGTATISIENGYILIHGVPDLNGRIQVTTSQLLAAKSFELRPYCLSWLYESDCNVRLYAGNPSAMSSSVKDFSVVDGITLSTTVLTPTDITNGLACNIQVTATTEFHLKLYATKLELGPVQTLAHKEGDVWVLNETPNYAEQHAICEEYSPITGEFVGFVSDDTSALLGGAKTVDNAFRRVADITLPTVTVMTESISSVKIENTKSTAPGISGTTDDNGIFDAHLSRLGTWRVTVSVNGIQKVREFEANELGMHYTVRFLDTHIYGACWSGGPETTWSRTDEAEGFVNPDPFVNDGNHPGYSPFDNLMPWSGMKIVDDSALGKLVSIPKYWYKWMKSGAEMTLQISNKEQEGFYVSPAHADRGDGEGERDVVYVGRYHCGATAYKSVSGQNPKVNITRATARDAISALDATAWQYDFAMYWTIMMLYLVEFADWDVQKVIGYGCGNGGGETQYTQVCGTSDNMGYHTGTMQISRDIYGVGCQYRHIEGLWDNCFDWVDGIRLTNEGIYCIKNPRNFLDNEGGVLIGTRRIDIDGYIKAWDMPNVSGFEWALIPSEVGGAESVYVSDYCYSRRGGTLLAVGGRNYDNSQIQGIFYMNFNYTANTMYPSLGCRLMKLP